MDIKLKCAGLLASLLVACNLNAQERQSITLLDESNQAVEGVAYRYGNQQGISGPEGTIAFYLLPDETMQLTHVSYGHWEWDESQLKEHIRTGEAFLTEMRFPLQPVTVLGIRPLVQAGDRMDMDYEDHMQHDAGEILNQTPSIQGIRKSGAYGSDPVFRGFKYDQLNIVFNGSQGATAACPNRMDPPTSQMAPNLMDRIEILKGPYALRYGTGIGATLNFIPSPLRFGDQDHLFGRVSTEYVGNSNTLRSEAQIGLSHAKSDIRLLAAWSQGDDYRDGNGMQVPADFPRSSLGLDAGLQLHPRHRLRMSTLYNRARDVDFPALPMDLRCDDTWMLNLDHEANLRGKHLRSWHNSLYASFVNHFMDNRLKPLDPRTMNAETSATTRNLGGRSEGSWIISRGTLHAGADVRMEGAEGTRIREFLMGPMAGSRVLDNAWQDSRITKSAVFAEYQVQGSRIHAIVSGRFEINRAEVLNPAEEFAEIYPDTRSLQVNPGLSLGLKKSLGNRVETALWLGRVQRSASLTERYINYFPVGLDPYEMLGNPSLKPEVNNQADLTFQWTERRTRLDIDFFLAYMQNYISSVIDPELLPRLPLSPGVRQFTNLESAMKSGLELNWVQELPWGLEHRLSLAYTRAKDLESGEPLPEIAPLDLRFRLQGEYLKGKLLPGLLLRHAMAQERISESYGETVTPSFTLVDVHLAVRATEWLRFSLGVNNLFDTAYYEHLSRSVQGSTLPIFAMGRNASASVNIRF
ncbi:MAG: TonB-dependent receptor [Bacteroidales bacterium]